MEDFADRLQTLMDVNGDTWKNVSTDLRIGKNQLKYWKDHHSAPNGETLQKLAYRYDVTVDYLLGVTNELGIKETEVYFPYISDEEMALIRQFRLLDDEGKIMVRSALIQESRRKKQKGYNNG